MYISYHTHTQKKKIVLDINNKISNKYGWAVGQKKYVDFTIIV